METSNTAVPDEPEEDLSDIKQPLMRVMRSLVFREAAEAPFSELPFLQVRCLHVLGRQEGRKMHEIAEKLQVKLPAMSQIVDRLVKRGMVERRDDPDDRRIVRLYLSENARQILLAARQARRARLRATISFLSPEERSQVAQGLRLLAAATEQLDAPLLPPMLSLDNDPLVEMMASRSRVHRVRPSANRESDE